MDIKNKLLCSNVENRDGKLYFAGAPVGLLAKKYGTPLYLLDENMIRQKCRVYKNALEKNFGKGYKVAYASKAASFKKIYSIMTEEEMCVDVVSSGELFTAKAAGFDLSRAFFHSNNKTDFDVETGIKEGVGYFVADSLEEIRRIDFFAEKYGKKQKILLRLTPGIDPHTFSAVATGKVDSKFGFSLASGQAAEAGMLAKSLPNVVLDGFHCHIGSQLFDSDVYIASAKIMLGFIKEFSEKTSFVCNTLDLGGGYGVRYLPSHPEVDIAKNIDVLSSFIKDECKRLGIPLPVIVLEPGRSVVADAGMTVYEVGSVKKIPGYINYVSVDGGMADNVRYAMYDSPYTVLPVELDEKKKGMICTLAGRCCESGDVIQPNIELPEDIKRGDFVAVETTGAYNYSMASNYNRLPRPPVVMIKDGKDFLAVRRESYEDLIRNDL